MLAKLIKLAKQAKRRLKKVVTPKPFLSFCRRIEGVKTKERVVAMTFDDGPSLLPPNPDHFGGRGLTEVLLDALDKAGGKGTFDVIGDTSENYPDKVGKPATPAWGGTRYDHYPRFGEDAYGGAVHAPALLQRMVQTGHQITNHTYRHVLFGKKNVVYRRRAVCRDVTQVVQDLKRLHQTVEDTTGSKITMSRPPHYVDRIAGGYSSYDVYDFLGYQYMAASFDGAGWLPCETYEEEIEAMISPLRQALEKDPDSLCGQIIFQKDGCNMALRTPVAHALPKQLALLQKYGYRVITVNELLERSPFQDVDERFAAMNKVRLFAQKRPVAYSDNTLRLHKPMTAEALALLFAPFPRDQIYKRRQRVQNALAWCIKHGFLPSATTGNVVLSPMNLTERCKAMLDFMPNDNTRGSFFEAVRADLLDQIAKETD